MGSPLQQGEPMTTTPRTYWYLPLGPGYEIGIASTPEHAQAYAVSGFERISRDNALRRMLQGPATRITIDHVPLKVDQKTFAKNLRAKKAWDIAA
jgi:hypothetical protein